MLWSAEEQKSTEILYLSLEVEDPLFWQLPAEMKKERERKNKDFFLNKVDIASS